MRIGIDIRCLAEGRRTGVEEYAINLLENLFAIDKKNKYVLFLNSFRRSGINTKNLTKHKNVSIRCFRYPNKLLNLFFWYLDWPKIDKMLGGVDVIFFPNIIFGAWSKNVKAIFTVHDLSFERYPQTFSLKRRLWHVFINPGKLCRKADKIITVSQSSKNDITDFYGVENNKINVISSAVSQKFFVMDRNNPKLIEVKKKYGLPYKFVLYLGTIEPRKNIIAIVRAYNQLCKVKHPELEKYKLVIAGAPGWKKKKIFDEIKNSPYRKDIILAGYICDEDKPALYNLASLFVYPSFFEGFGFPPLEAMNCGVPVIVSNMSSLPEVIGGAGIMVDPDKPDEIFQAMREILLNRELREKLRIKGFEQAKKFTWEKTAWNFLAIIQDLKG